jgi:SulP family sulfate permease
MFRFCYQGSGAPLGESLGVEGKFGLLSFGSVEKSLSTERQSHSLFPVADWLFNYPRDWLRLDLIAGLTAAAVVIPKAMAYATIAGLPVQVGLYTAIVPMLIYAVLGTSRPLSVSTTTTIAVLTAAELGEIAPGGDPPELLRATAMLTLMVGGVLVLASLLRLGFIANFISEPVLVGFKAGIGIVIMLDQVPKILGVHFPRRTFFRNVLAIARGVPETSLPTLVVGLLMIALLVGIERFLPKAPAPLIAVAVGILGVRFLGLQAHAVELVGRIPQGLPSITRPEFSLAEALWPGALGIALMSFTESIAAARAFAKTEEPPLRANRELLATGLANAGGSFFGAMPAGGGTTQTAVNRLAGAHTQFAEIVTVVVGLATILLLAPVLALMPQATLAAVVIVYSIGLIRPAEFSIILGIRRTEFTWALAALIGVVLLGTLKGILVAIVLSLVALASQVADPPVYVLGRKPGTNVFRPRSKEHPEDETYPGLLLLRLEGRVFFANAQSIGQKIRFFIDEAKPTVVALDLGGVPDLEYTALKMLSEGEKRQRELGASLWLVGLNPGVLQMLQRSPLGTVLGRERMQFSLELAVSKYVEMSTRRAQSQCVNLPATNEMSQAQESVRQDRKRSG